jgi:catechol 2,3-dioxygenase-like lactoylglutathione lyase family enzyme
VAFTIASEEFDAMRHVLEQEGVVAWQENHSHGRSFYFLDPDGHKLEIHASDLQSRLEALIQNPPKDLMLY